jgi:hypothetical protein
MFHHDHVNLDLDLEKFQEHRHHVHHRLLLLAANFLGLVKLVANLKHHHRVLHFVLRHVTEECELQAFHQFQQELLRLSQHLRR